MLATLGVRRLGLHEAPGSLAAAADVECPRDLGPADVSLLDAVPALLHAVLAPLQLAVNLLGYHSEGLLHVVAQLRARLQEWNLVIICQILKPNSVKMSCFLRCSAADLSLLAGDLPVVAHGEVRLAAHEDEGCLVRLNVPPRLLQPHRDVLETVHVAHVVRQHPAHTATNLMYSVLFSVCS